MQHHRVLATVRFVAACLVAIPLAKIARAAEPLRFARDVRPILSSRCFPCHGPDGTKREAELRLDERAHALKAGESGEIAIVAGKPEASEFVRRLFSKDAEEAMPPTDSNKTLTAQQKEILRRWVAEGATFEGHWAMTAPRRAPAPPVRKKSWPRNAIDHFILARLEREGLEPSAEAEHPTLIRRLSLDLTGLPPTPEDVGRFEREMTAAGKDAAPSAAADLVYETWVNKLLDSPHYGERMAVDWLDAARFADTNGYQVDRNREMYAWRDWVIAAFNANKSFDQFTIEQIAGDLLPEATLQQKIATGFHRNHMYNEEGGVIPKEFLMEYCADRVETTATVWLGQTFNCARCHDHKFDSFTMRDYYGLYAFFHNVSEKGIGNYGASIRRNAPPMLKLPAPELEAKISALKEELADTKQQLAQTEANDQAPIKKRIQTLTKQIDQTDLQIPTTLVMQELPTPRPTHILIRGAYNKKDALVTADTPASLPGMSSELPRNRLGLARWLVDPANPLPARVTVNRFWQSLFGTGLVRTAEDFGTQGESPTHPKVLDWLATEFVRTGWDVKAMMRLIVTSSTYRQSSRLTPELRERDPQNRLLARGPRFRLQAEFLRDQALAASGLLVTKIGGPSVRPYHPPGLYEQVVSGKGAKTWVVGKGDELYRRSMYTYWKRSVPHPGMLVFDAPFREVCAVRRSRTNTPLQALNLMNDPTYVEAARFLAQRMIREGGSTAAEQLTHGFRLILARAPRAAELAILVAAHERAIGEFQSDPAGAAALVKVGTSPADSTIETVRLAALTTVASTILNLDETVTKE